MVYHYIWDQFNSLALFKKKIQNISFYLTMTIVIYNDISTYIHIFLFYYILNFIGNNYCKQPFGLNGFRHYINLLLVILNEKGNAREYILQ